MPEGEDPGLFRAFLSTFVRPMFARCSSRIEDLQVTFPDGLSCAILSYAILTAGGQQNPFVEVTAWQFMKMDQSRQDT